MQFLVIEDEPAVASAVADGLQRDGHGVVVAGGGQEGLELLARHRVDAVFLDLRIWDMDGLDVLARIRGTHAELPVVVFSAWATPENCEAARRLGATAVLPKPLTLTRLTEALRIASEPKG